VLVPPLIMGLGLAAAMKWFGVDPSMYTIVAGHVVVTIPFVLLILVSRLRDYDVDLDPAARDLGATAGEVLRRVTWPLIAPSVWGAVVVAAAISMDEVLVTNFTSGTTATVPLFVLSRMRRTIDPSINVVATLLIVVPWVALLAWFLASRSLRRAGSLQDIAGGA
jgi:spermidine/putrescine transport system permease protein